MCAALPELDTLRAVYMPASMLPTPVAMADYRTVSTDCLGKRGVVLTRLILGVTQYEYITNAKTAGKRYKSWH